MTDRPPEHQQAVDLLREIRAKNERVVCGLITELQAAGYEPTVKRDKSGIDHRLPQWILSAAAEQQDREVRRHLLLIVGGAKVSVLIRPIVSRRRYAPATVSGRLAVSVGPAISASREDAAGWRIAEGAKGFSYARIVAAVRQAVEVVRRRREEAKRRRAADEAREDAVVRVRQAAFSDHDVDSAEGVVGLRVGDSYCDDRPVKLDLECDEATALAVVRLLRERHAGASASQEKA